MQINWMKLIKAPVSRLWVVWGYSRNFNSFGKSPVSLGIALAYWCCQRPPNWYAHDTSQHSNRTWAAISSSPGHLYSGLCVKGI